MNERLGHPETRADGTKLSGGTWVKSKSATPTGTLQATAPSWRPDNLADYGPHPDGTTFEALWIERFGALEALEKKIGPLPDFCGTLAGLRATDPAHERALAPLDLRNLSRVDGIGDTVRVHAQALHLPPAYEGSILSDCWDFDADEATGPNIEEDAWLDTDGHAWVALPANDELRRLAAASSAITDAGIHPGLVNAREAMRDGVVPPATLYGFRTDWREEGRLNSRYQCARAAQQEMMTVQDIANLERIVEAGGYDEQLFRQAHMAHAALGYIGYDKAVKPIYSQIAHLTQSRQELDDWAKEAGQAAPEAVRELVKEKSESLGRALADSARRIADARTQNDRGQERARKHVARLRSKSIEAHAQAAAALRERNEYVWRAGAPHDVELPDPPSDFGLSADC